MKKSSVEQQRLDRIRFQGLEEANKIDIEKEFFEDEVLKGLKECNGEKAPRPDGRDFCKTVELHLHCPYCKHCSSKEHQRVQTY